MLFNGSVNLPRWGLKQKSAEALIDFFKSVNLPRWGLKPASPAPIPTAPIRVNLPRWGLKLNHGKDQEIKV